MNHKNSVSLRPASKQGSCLALQLYRFVALSFFSVLFLQGWSLADTLDVARRYAKLDTP